MNTDLQDAKCPPDCGNKQALMRQLVEQYPAIDVDALRLSTHIQAVAKLHTALVTQSLAKYDLTEARLYVLCNLIMHERAGQPEMSPSAISDHLEITRATVTSLLDGLQQLGYIVREHSGEDRRAIKVRVTEKARIFLDEFMSGGTPRLTKAFGFLTDAESKLMVKWLDQIARNLEQVVE